MNFINLSKNILLKDFKKDQNMKKKIENSLKM